MFESDRTAVLVRATDPILQGGVAVTLRTRPEVWLVDEDSAEARSAVVFVLVADRLDDQAVKLLRTLQCGGHSHRADRGAVDDNEILTAVENGVCAVARRSDTADALVRLAQAVATGDGALPPDLLGRLLAGSPACSATCWSRAACTWAALRPGRSRCCGWSPKASPPRRSPSSCATRSAPSRRSCTTSPTASTCATARTPWRTPS